MHTYKIITRRYLSASRLAGAPALLPPGRRDEHGEVDQHREPGGHRLQDHRGPRLGEWDDGALLQWGVFSVVINKKLVVVNVDRFAYTDINSKLYNITTDFTLYKQ